MEWFNKQRQAQNIHKNPQKNTKIKKTLKNAKKTQTNKSNHQELQNARNQKHFTGKNI